MPAASSPSRTRGRPPKLPPETPAQRIARLQAELERAQLELRTQTDRQAVIVGRAVIAHLPDEPPFAAQVLGVLHMRVTRKEDRAAIASLLAQDGKP